MRVLALLLVVCCASREEECSEEERRSKWRSRGRIFVCQPNVRLGGGGAASMHQIHHEVLRAGMSSGMYAVNPRFATNYSVNMSENEFISLSVDQGLGAEDVLFLPEIAQFNDDFVKETQRRGGVLVRMLLGVHPYFDHLDRRVLNVGRTEFIRRQIFGSVGPVLQPPLEDSIYRAAEEYAFKKQYEKPWPRLVLIDDDTFFDEGGLALDIEELSNGTVRLLNFRGFDRATTIDIFKNATLFVDAYIPGIERALWEAALFHVLPLINQHHHGASLEDFPIEAVPRFEAGAPGLADTIIHHALKAHTRRPHLERYLNARARAWPERFSHDLTDMLYSRHFDIHTVWQFSIQEHLEANNMHFPTFAENDWLLPLLVSTLCLSPLSAVVVFVRDSQTPQLPSFVDNQQIHDFWLRIFLGPAAFDLLHHLGLVDRIRFRFQYGPQDDDLLARPFALHLPPRSILINSPKALLSEEGILAENNQHFAFHTQSHGALSCIFSSMCVLLVSHNQMYSFSRRPRHVVDAVFSGTAWKDMPQQLQAETSQLYSDLTFTSAGHHEEERQNVTSLLREHPLWETFFPLFHSNVRRILGGTT